VSLKEESTHAKGTGPFICDHGRLVWPAGRGWGGGGGGGVVGGVWGGWGCWVGGGGWGGVLCGGGDVLGGGGTCFGEPEGLADVL